MNELRGRFYTLLIDDTEIGYGDVRNDLQNLATCVEIDFRHVVANCNGYYAHAYRIRLNKIHDD